MNNYPHLSLDKSKLFKTEHVNSGIKRVMKIRDSLHKKCANSRILITYANIRFKGIKLITWLSMQSKFFLNPNDFLDENSSDPKLFDNNLYQSNWEIRLLSLYFVYKAPTSKLGFHWSIHYYLNVDRHRYVNKY
jgi:hypothetical protein